MKVKNFNLIPNINSETYQLIVDGKLISKNTTYIDVKGNFVQIDICSHCYTIGCSDSGYVEILDIDEIIIWKEPYKSAQYNYYNDFISAYGMKYGSIIWTKSKYNQLVSILNKNNVDAISEVKYKGIPIDSGFDLWRINGSKTYRPDYHDSFSIDELLNSSIGMYSGSFTEEECFNLFYESMKLWKSGNKIELFQVNDEMGKIVMMFDSPTYIEWDCLYLKNNKILFPIGDNYLLEIS